MRVIRNVFRRKLRAFLTIFGITIGVLSLVVMGAMTEKLTLLVNGGVRYYGDKVTVTTGTSIAGYSGSPLTTNRIADIERVPGVARASAALTMLLDKEFPTVSFGNIPTINASDGRDRGYETFIVSMAQGRDLRLGETGKVTVGSDLVNKLNARVGGTVTIRDKKFDVVGIAEKTLTAPDQAVVMSLRDAQDLYAEDLPAAVKQSVDPHKLATSFVVYVKPGKNPDVIARLINHELPDLKASGPTEFITQIVASLSTLNAIIIGIAMISLMVGGLSVINTMTMAVSERTREIGIRKAIGASNGAIMRQFIAEAAIIGMTGGLTGLVLGWMFTSVVNAAMEVSGTPLFLVTTRLAVGSVLFATVLGVFSGLYPAWHAANLNPVEALRHE
jgi:putative ABC transport system permease protein